MRRSVLLLSLLRARTDRLVGCAFVGCLLASTTGCALRTPYATETSWPHKDVAEVHVFVRDALDSEEYLRIAQLEAGRLTSTPREPPLFLVRFVFLESAADNTTRHARANPLAELKLSTNGALAFPRGELVERSTSPNADYFAISSGTSPP
jgi:hypothetical protein